MTAPVDTSGEAVERVAVTLECSDVHGTSYLADRLDDAATLLRALAKERADLESLLAVRNEANAAASAEALQAVGYENDDGTLYGYANHLNYAGNPGGIPVRIMRESDYVALAANAAAFTASDAYQRRLESADKIIADALPFVAQWEASDAADLESQSLMVKRIDAHLAGEDMAEGEGK